jgi:hypothetical protein
MVSLTCGVGETSCSWTEARVEKLGQNETAQLHQSLDLRMTAPKSTLKKETPERTVVHFYTADSLNIRQELLFLETGCG